MVHLSWRWILILSIVQDVLSRQEFLKQPQYAEVNPGQTAWLECSILNKKGRCVWQKDRKPQGIFPGKYEWSGDEEKGDCSLRVLNASLEYDDGMWECQVTASSLEHQDELSSVAARLLVREAPQKPTLEIQTSPLLEGMNVTVSAGRNTSFACISRYGNPPASIKWYIDDEDVTHSAAQNNASEPDRPKLWQAVSVLSHVFRKENNKQSLACVAVHDAYERKAMGIQVPLDVQYPPSVTMVGKPKGDIEDGKDSVTLQCTADANPPAFTIWRKDGIELATSEVIHLNPINKDNDGVYTCESRNSMGSSDVLSYHLDVKYPPQNVRITPRSLTVAVHNQSSLTCSAAGNPAPKFIWLFSATGDPNKAKVLETGSQFFIKNATYSFQGTYVCVAMNSIGSDERTAYSEELTVNVVGIPQVLNTSSFVEVEKGEDAILDVPFCSDPPPTTIQWEWDTLKLTVGEGKGKYIAEQIPLSPKQGDCYEARLIVQKADPSDAHRYLLTVKNEKGTDSYIMTLNVTEPVSMSAVIGIVIGCLTILVIIVLVILYAFRSEKWCFRKSEAPQTLKASKNGDLQDIDIESDMSSIKGTLPTSQSSRTGAIPPDALYSVPPKRYIKSDDEKDSEFTSSNSQNDQNENPRRTAPELMYANLDLPKHEGKLTSFPRRSHTEYAEVQYRPQAHEIADI